MFILAYKETGETTKDFSDRIKKKHNAEYAAICGKLDPMARGVTKVLLDENRKLMDNYLKSVKVYTFELVIGIKTKSDDILGEITHTSHDSQYYEKVIIYLIDRISNQNKQKFQPYSDKRITINNIRKPLHYFSRNNLISDENLPEKKVSVNNMKIENTEHMTFDIYKKKVIRNLDMVNNDSRKIFNVDQIINLWNKLKYNEELTSIRVTMEVSSGYYIRMIPYYIYKDLGIPTHIFDILRIST